MVGERTGFGISGLVSWKIQGYNAPMDVESGPGESFWSLKKRSPANQSSAKLHWSYFLVATQNSTQAANWLNINFVALLLSITFPKPKVFCLFLGEINHSSPFCLFSSIIKSSRPRAQKRRNCRRRFSPSRKMSSLGFPTSPPTWTGTPCSGWKKATNKKNALMFRLLVIVTRSGSIRLFGQPGDSSWNIQIHDKKFSPYERCLMWGTARCAPSPKVVEGRNIKNLVLAL